MTKSYQDINKKDDQQESLLSDVLAILKKHSLTFSEQGVRSILKVIKSYQSSPITIRPTISQKRKQIKSLKDTARKLSAQIQELSPHIALGGHLDSLQLMLDHLVSDCEHSLTQENSEKLKKVSGHEGRPPKELRLKFLIQMLIIIYEKETGQSYVTKEASGWGRERNAYCPLVHKYVEGIIKCVAPDQDVHEALKAARRSPVPLDWTRKMVKKVDEDFQKNPDNF
jgi:hypothetical protein